MPKPTDTRSRLRELVTARPGVSFVEAAETIGVTTNRIGQLAAEGWLHVERPPRGSTQSARLWLAGLGPTEPVAWVAPKSSPSPSPSSPAGVTPAPEEGPADPDRDTGLPRWLLDHLDLDDGEPVSRADVEAVFRSLLEPLEAAYGPDTWAGWGERVASWETAQLRSRVAELEAQHVTDTSACIDSDRERNQARANLSQIELELEAVLDYLRGEYAACSHQGVGLPGCPTCGGRWRPETRRAVQEHRDRVEAQRVRVAEIERQLDQALTRAAAERSVSPSRDRAIRALVRALGRMTAGDGDATVEGAVFEALSALVEVDGE